MTPTSTIIKNNLLDGVCLPIIVFLAIICLPYPTHASFIGAGAVDRPESSLSNGLVAHWTFDGNDMVSNVADVSGNGKHGNFVGFTSTSSVQVAGPVGQAFKFDGVNNHYINVPASVTDFSTSDFSISFWAKFDQAESPNRGIIYKGMYGTRGWGIWRGGGYGGSLILATKITGGTAYTKTITIDKYPLKKWAHFVWTVDRDNSANSKVFVNGISQTTSGSTIGTAVMDDIDPLMLGGWTFADESNISMDDVRIYNRALSASEAKQLYSQNVSKISSTPPKQSSTGLNSGLVGHWTFDGKDLINNVTDRSGNGNHGAMSGFTSTSSAVVAGKLGQGLQFDGVDDYIKTASTVNFGGTKVITTSFWLNWDAYANDDDFVMELSSNSNTNDGTFMIYPNGSTYSAFTVVIQDKSSGSGFCIETFTRPSAGKWHHYSIIFDNSTIAGSITAYVDGVEAPTTARLNTKDQTSDFKTDTLYMMSRGGTTLFGAGKLDDVRIYSRALSATEIEQLYNQSATKFAATPPKQSTTGLNSGLVGHWTFDGKDLINNVTDRSGNGNHGYMQNFTSTSSAVVAGKLGQALYFSGASNSYINVGQNSSLSLGTADFTISFWLNRTSDSCGFIFTNKFQLFYDNSCTIFTFRKSGGTETKISSLPTLNKWVNVIIRRSSGTMTAYYDGVSKTISSGGTNNDDISNSALDLYFGHNTNALKSKIDEIRIYSRALSATEIKQLYNMGR